MIPAVMATYDRFGIAFERGDGAYLYSTDGRRSTLARSRRDRAGHCHPHATDALCAPGPPALALLEPLPYPRSGAPGAAARGRHLRRCRFLLQLRRGSDRDAG